MYVKISMGQECTSDAVLNTESLCYRKEALAGEPWFSKRSVAHRWPATLEKRDDENDFVQAIPCNPMLK